MTHKEIISLDESKYEALLKPVKRARKVISNPCIIGYDTEYTRNPDGSPHTLSIQLAVGSHVNLTLMPDGVLTKDVLLSAVIEFLAEECGYKEIPDDIYLVSFFAQAEVSNFDSFDEMQITQSKSDAMYCRIPCTATTIHIKDLGGLFARGSSLDKVGKYIGIPKVSLEGIGGKPAEYWYNNMDLLLQQHPEEYREYAVIDAVIAYEAYTRVRQLFLDKYQVDVLHFNSILGIAAYVFRLHYLKTVPTPIKVMASIFKQKHRLVSGEKWYIKVRRLEVFGGSLDVRRMALECYHGGRNESFYCGRLEDTNLTYYDVKSIYPSAARLQPLPVASTEWRKLSGNVNPWLLRDAEGFVVVEFKFPESTQYPCLPVVGAREDILYFPLDGTSYCTLSELRLAIKLGLKDYRILSGFVFIPGDAERNHPVTPYMVDMLANKNKATKDTVDYELFKLLANGLVGKFAERRQSNIALDLVKDELVSREDYTKVNRKIPKPSAVGSLWMPEWASLILGKARSLIGEFVALGSYFVSTDSVLLPSTVDISCDALTQLQSVDSTLDKQLDVTHGVLVRTKLYTLNPLGDKRQVARHSVHSIYDDFLKLMQSGYETKVIPNLSYTRKLLRKYDECIRLGVPLNSEYIYNGTVSLHWDDKRVLDNPVSNPFAESSFSKPLSFADTKKDRHRKKAKDKLPRGRKPSVDKALISQLYHDGNSQSDIARNLGVSRQYVSQVIKESNYRGITHDA